MRVPNVADAIAPASREAEAWLGARQASAEARYFVSLAIEELLTNFIKYGSDTALHHVEFTLTLSPRDLTLEVVDEGYPFDPLQAPAPDFTAPLEDRAKGGLGLHLLREMADRITYERRDGRNRLTLVTHRI